MLLTTIHYSVIYYLLASAAVGATFIKEWRPVDTDFQNRFNWEGDRLPCPKSLVVLPEEVIISVYLNGTATWDTLVMPQTGELVLEDGFNFIQDFITSDCTEGEVHFKHWRPSSWFDPDQWQLSDPDGITILSPLAVPHSERVPCQHDSVHLSNKHSLSVTFDNVASITVGQIKYGEQTMTVDEWRNRLNGPEWRYQVHNPPSSVYLNGTECQDPLGCLCTADANDVSKMQKVCSNAGILCSNQLECPDGFRPPGHCCDMCGAMMKLTVDDKIFTKSALDRLVSSMLTSEDAITNGLMSYSYRTSVNTLHLTLVDNTTNEKSIALADKIHAYLIKDRGNGNLYGIVALEMIRSGISQPASHHLTPEELHLIASNVATVFGTLVLIGLVAAAYYFYRKKMSLSGSREGLNVSFARFDNDRIEIGGIDDSSNLDPSSGARSGGSGRPMTTAVPSPYAEEPVLPDTLPSPTLPSAWKKLRRSFVNPLFGDASVGHRMSGRWQMSTLMMTTNAEATQENPVYDIDMVEPPLALVPDAAPSSERSTAVTPLSVDEVITTTAVKDFPNPVPHPAVPDAPAGSPFEEDDVDEEKAAEAITINDESIRNVLPESRVEDVAPLVGAMETESEPTEQAVNFKTESSNIKSTDRIKNKPLKTLWKKATKKFSSSSAAISSAPTITGGGVAGAGAEETSATSSTVGSEATAEAKDSTEHKTVIRSSSQQQQRDDEIQLTLAEETDDE